MRFNKITQNAFESMQFEAGIVTKVFNPDTGELPVDANIITATSGGVKIDCTPNYIDLGEDVDNCPNGTKELKRLDYYECKLGFTALNYTADTFALAIGAVDVDGVKKVTPKADLDLEDFEDAIWWIGDVLGGGFVAVKVMNALSSGGLSLQSTKKGKGNLAVELQGHYSMTNMDKVPMEFYFGE